MEQQFIALIILGLVFVGLVSVIVIQSRTIKNFAQSVESLMPSRVYLKDAVKGALRDFLKEEEAKQ